MSKGKTKPHLGSRSGSNSNNASRASASDERHARKQMVEDRSIKLGSDNRGKRKEGQGGTKRETR